MSIATLSGVLLAQIRPSPLRPQPVKVERVEPSCWRMGAPEEMVLRLSGEHLDTVVGVKVKHKGVRVTHLESQDDGHLLVTLHIAPNAEPGTLVLQVFTRYVTTFAELPMNPAPQESGVLSASQ